MQHRPLGARALGGGDLTGSRIVKIAYVDEAGIQASDPWCVVAGVIVDPDRQYQQVRARLDELKDEHAAYIKGDPRGIIFHAKDIYHGTKHFHRDCWPFEVRMQLLESLAHVVNDFALPFIATAVERSAVFKDLRDQLDVSDLLGGAHAVAYGIAAMSLERYMRTISEDEMAQLVCENNNEMRARIKSLHAFLANPGPDLKDEHAQYLPLGRIIDTVHFVEKTESGPLQLADLIAWITARRTIDGKHSEKLASIISPQWIGPSLRASA